MVNQALLASVDSLDADELDELMEYVATKRIDPIALTGEQSAMLDARRGDSNPANWLTDGEFDTRLDALID
jgi:hypothetical protein